MTRTTLILAAILLLPVAAQPMLQVNAQGPIPYYGPDGQAHNRGVPHAATFAPRQYLVQQYEPPNVPPDIIAPERPRVSPRQPKAAPPIVILPLDPPEPEPTTPAPAPTVPAESMPNPLTEWCGQEANAKAPLCRNMGSPKVQR
jgi:hypothetical protein